MLNDMLQWSSAYETGYEPIDREHRVLVERLNAFGIALKNGIANERLMELLTFLESYTEHHFAHEENCMAKFKCPVAQANKLAHRQFREQIVKVREYIKSSGATTNIAISLHRGLCKWLREHIMKVDSHIGKCAPKNHLENTR